MLSQKGRYALRALLVLAEHAREQPMMIAQIAEQAKVPRKFLEQILLDLKRRGIGRSLRGRQGGYLLGRAPKDITLADVIPPTDAPLALRACVSAPTDHRRAECVDEATRALR